MMSLGEAKQIAILILILMNVQYLLLHLEWTSFLSLLIHVG